MRNNVRVTISGEVTITRPCTCDECGRVEIGVPVRRYFHGVMLENVAGLGDFAEAEGLPIGWTYGVHKNGKGRHTRCCICK